MTPHQIQTPQDLETYIEGCINDLELGISTKEETLINIMKCRAVIIKKAKSELLQTLYDKFTALAAKPLNNECKGCMVGYDYRNVIHSFLVTIKQKK